MSDVWKDVLVPLPGTSERRLDPETESRIVDFLTTPGVETIAIIDATDIDTLPRALDADAIAGKMPPLRDASIAAPIAVPTVIDPIAALIVVPIVDPIVIDPTRSTILTGDCLGLLPQIPDGSVDLIFLDPPYNLDKPYASYTDDMAVEEYFTWCDTWLEQCVRVLRPGGSLIIINIPLGSIRHALYLDQRLTFQNWIAWDALSQPRGYIMPAHYPLIWYTKGEPTAEEWPSGFVLPIPTGEETSTVLARPDGLCLRPACITKRAGQYHGGRLSDLWTDIFRVLHTSQRYDHPCILPPKIMHRVIAIFDPLGGIVLDPFNGVGTTTLAADHAVPSAPM